MTSWVLNSETWNTAIGEVLASAADSGIEIQDEQGKLVAEILVYSQLTMPNCEALAEAEAKIDELRRRRNSDRSQDLTTQQLLARLTSLAKE